MDILRANMNGNIPVVRWTYGSDGDITLTVAGELPAEGRSQRTAAGGSQEAWSGATVCLPGHPGESGVWIPTTRYSR